MSDWAQGDIIRISGYRGLFLIISNNTFIRATGVFHVCPVSERLENGPLHIAIRGKNGCCGTAACEQLKLIDPDARSCSRTDAIPYSQLMDISDAVQGMFEYD